ncbi:Protein ATP11, mitochondrial [Psilocybe cubensis]|uniref:Protein ATP11, mitochondrial n=2 Tax=Psilocybe cubensis TaxID=181762 RepID=A0ACB8HFS6_PSICU|nr:Protein ATP11, mitochondrial [Psilocybe cubensis]KAH9486684.1 Protein ATP11, mitochondrial [Psilocybe cubensis]
MAIRLVNSFKYARVAQAPLWFTTRALSTNSSKYTQKLRERAEEQGLTISQLLEKVRADEGKRRKEEAEKLKAATALLRPKPALPASTTSGTADKVKTQLTERKDAAPFKPLSSILNVSRILATPHTPEQITALWTAYHATRSGGTGRGYVCASIPLDMFYTMMKTGRQYPTFILPLPREQPADPTVPPPAPGEHNVAHEFYFMQWDFHAPPEVPSASEDPFTKPGQSFAEVSNPAAATVLFTPLQEYKLRGAFSTPYLVLTMYTDLAATHSVILMRGEITPSTTGVDRYMLNQEDAQILAMSLQKFYLWNNDGKDDGERLLRTFHEKPEEFKWQELLDFSKLTV